MTTPAAAAQAPAEPAKPETPAAPAPAAPAATPEQPKPQDPGRRSMLAPGEQKPDAQPAAQEPEGKPKDGPPEAYEVKVPEGIKLEKADVERWTKDAKDLGLTPDQASKLIAYQDRLTKDAVKAQADNWAKQGDEWYGALEKDPEFGGANLKASEAAVQKALVQFDPKGELVADLARYGIDNLPSLVKALRRIGLAAAEDTSSVDAAKKAPALSEDDQRLAKRYDSPDMQKLMGRKK